MAGVAATGGSDDEPSVPEEEEGEGKGGGTAQERGRKRDMYKIRSLLLQVI